jgi:HD-like signal output (HDOD) protein
MGLERTRPLDDSIPAFAESGEAELAVWEAKRWGFSNPEIAEKILAHWGLPNEAIVAVRHHYNGAGRHNPIIHLLKLAAAAAADRFSAIQGEDVYWKLTPENFSRAGITHKSFQNACERAHKKFDRLRIAIA